MPPKKDNKSQNDKPDNTGIPKNDVSLKLNFTIESGQQPPQCVVMYEWFAGNDKFDRYDAGLVEGWTKKQSSLVFEKQLDSIRVDDDFCKNLSSHKFYIYFVNPQTSIVEDQLSLDYSSLLFQKTDPIFYEFKSTTIKVQNIDSFSIRLQADKDLLTEMYRQYLNPLQVEIVGALDPPQDSSSKYLPTYVKYKFFDDTIVSTHPLVGQDKIIWQHKHVFLAGLMNPVQLKEKIRSTYLRFQFHDRDQVQNNKLKEDIELFDIAKAIAQQMEKDNPIQQDPKKKGAPGKKQPEKKQAKKQIKKDTKKKDAKIADPILPQKIQTLNNNYGVAVFSLVQFLKPAVRAAKYKSPVIPRTMFEDFQSRNIDLNTTARNQMQKVLFSNNYFDHDTTIVVAFNLSYPVGSFVEKYGSDKVKSPTQTAINIDENLKRSLNNFERVVVFLPYKDKENIEKLENIFYDINMKAFGLKNKRQITTHLLKKQEKTSTELDYLSGIQMIDPQGRVYIIEGVKGKSITKIYQALPKQVFNRDKQKILKNTNILFTTRFYADFNIQLKRIRLRPSLSQILLDPSIYIKSKVDEKICENLNKLSDMRKLCDDLQTVSNMDLWPEAQILVQIQRKYSQSLTYEDINGQRQQKKQKGSSLSQTKQIKNIQFLQKQGSKFRTADDFFNTKTSPSQQQPNHNQTFDNTNTMKRTVHTKTFVRDNPMKETYNFHLTKMPEQNEPVYIYASQKQNWYEKQNQLLRERMQADKNKVYTMSKDYLSLSIDPHVLDIEAKKEAQLSMSKNFSPQRFSSLLVRTKQERMKIAKQPGPEDIADMIKYPYHEEKTRELDIKKSQRDKPVNNGKDDFAKYLKKIDMFSQPDVLEVQKMARVQEQRLHKEQKLKREQQQRKRLMGDPFMKVKKGYCSDKVANLDKYNNILQGSPNKKGLIDVHKKSKQKRPVQNYEVSLYLKEKINNPSWNPLVRVDDESKNTVGYEFNNYQKPQFLTKTGIYKPLKDN